VKEVDELMRWLFVVWCVWSVFDSSVLKFEIKRRSSRGKGGPKDEKGAKGGWRRGSQARERAQHNKELAWCAFQVFRG
jgi:hypothetical protein